MGATYIVETMPGVTPDEALEALRAHYRAQGYTPDEVPDGDDEHVNWPDPFEKGWVQVWAEPVKDEATEWMRGWTAQHAPEGVDPDDKWGPWMTFPLAGGGWMFFGWVNT